MRTNQRKDLLRAKEDGIFSILFDDTTDISKKMQMTVCVRYLHKNEYKEDFLKLVDYFEELRSNELETFQKVRMSIALPLAIFSSNPWRK